MIPAPVLPRRHPRPSVVLAGAIVVAAAASWGEAAMAQSITTGRLMSQVGPDLLILDGESQGVRVRALRRDGSGTPLRQGDLIVRADGIAPAMPEDLFACLRARPTPGSVRLVVRRGQEELTLTVGTDLFVHFMPPAPPSPPDIPS